MDHLTLPQLRALLEDTQASLAAAFARIEGFRIREKHLMSEVSELRQAVHGSSNQHRQLPPPCQPLDRGAAGAGIASTSGNRAAGNPMSRPSSMNVMPVASNIVAPPPTSALSISAEEVYIISHGKKVRYTATYHQPCQPCRTAAQQHSLAAPAQQIPASIVFTPEYIDFVEVKARVRREEFVGITTLKQGRHTKVRGSHAFSLSPPPVMSGSDPTATAAALGTCRVAHLLRSAVLHRQTLTLVGWVPPLLLPNIRPMTERRSPEGLQG